jgi:hypothetical protein
MNKVVPADGHGITIPMTVTTVSSGFASLTPVANVAPDHV